MLYYNTEKVKIIIFYYWGSNPVPKNLVTAMRSALVI